MKVLFSWLREFVDVPGSPQEVAATMSLRGFAVEGIDGSGDDAVIDFEVTADRPDCMCVAGIAREVATAYALPLRTPRRAAAPEGAADRSANAVPLTLTPLSAVHSSGDIGITIENADLCPRYAGAVADVSVGPSPDWMQARLRAAGVRPISNIVDITNYVLLELGQPMHAFDLAKLAGAEIRVRTARPGEVLKTLDGQARSLSADMLVIADGQKPAAVAGVMGGADSEVSATTRVIVLESAYFNPLSVRRTSKQLGLKTEASMRFERGADPNLPAVAMERACALLEALGAGRARGTVLDRYPAHLAPRHLRLRRARLAGVLGVTVGDADVARLLGALGFDAASAPEGWDVTIPTRRVDVLREVDLIEEVARHYGFDRIPATFPALRAAAPPVDPRITRARHLRDVLTGAGFFEAVTFGFIGEAAAAPFAADGDLAPIANPLSENFAVLRPSLLPGLLDAAAHNRRREQRDVRLFEIGARFSKSAGERRAIACVWTGASDLPHWSGMPADVTFFDMKGAVERVCAALRVTADVSVHQETWLVAGQAAAISSGATCIGTVGRLTPALAERHGLPGADAVFVAEIDLDAADQCATTGDVQVVPLPRHPSVTRDIAMLVDDSLPAAELRATVRGAAPASLVDVREFDRYQGKGIPEGKVSLALRLTFRLPERTLTDAEVQAAVDAVVAALAQRHHAIQR